MPFDIPTKNKMKTLKARREEWQKLVGLFVVIVAASFFVFFSLALYISEIAPQFEDTFKTIIPFFMLLLFIIVGVYFLRKKDIKLSFKENLLLNTFEASQNLENFHRSSKADDLKSAKNFLNKIILNAQADFGRNFGFNFEKHFRGSFYNLALLIKKNILPSLDSGLSSERYYEVSSCLHNIFINIDKEQFEKLEDQCKRLMKDYKISKKKIVLSVWFKFSQKIQASNPLKMTILFFLFIILYLVAWAVFSWLDRGYTHIAAFIAVVGVLALLHQFGILRSLEYTPKTKG